MRRSILSSNNVSQPTRVSEGNSTCEVFLDLGGFYLHSIPENINDNEIFQTIAFSVMTLKAETSEVKLRITIENLRG